MTIFFKLPPYAGHLSITDKFFKTRKCPLFRGFTVLSNQTDDFLDLFKNLKSGEISEMGKDVGVIDNIK